MIARRGPRAAHVWMVGVALVLACISRLPGTRANAAGPSARGSSPAADAPPVVCGTCHRLPPADVLPRPAWRDELVRMQRIRDGSEQTPGAPTPALPPDFAEALVWYEAHAPAALPPPASWPAPVVIAELRSSPADATRGAVHARRVRRRARRSRRRPSARARRVRHAIRDGVPRPPLRSRRRAHAHRARAESRARHGHRSRQGRHHRSAHRRSRRVPAARSRQGLGRLAARAGQRDATRPSGLAGCRGLPTSKPRTSTATAISICSSARSATGRRAACRSSRTGPPTGRTRRSRR